MPDLPDLPDLLEIAERSCRQKFASGARVEELVSELHSNGVSLLSSIKILRNACGISLGDAKKIVTGHSVWQTDVERNEPLHDAAEYVSGVADESE